MFGRATSLLFLLPLLFQYGNCLDLCSLNATQSDLISQVFNTSAALLCEISQTLNFTATAGKVTFLCYLPSGGDPVPITTQNASEVMVLSNPTKMIIHGWTDNGTLPWIREMAASLHQVETCNVVAVDWSPTASLGYPQAAVSTQAVGNVTGDFIIGLGAPYDSIHVIGHSLGAQVAGFTGKRVIAKTGTQIARISGLDPAGPLFEPALPQNRIDKTDAVFVDDYHTDIGVRGEKLPYAYKDFYFNGGLFQPNCSNQLINPVDATSCSHQWAHAYYNNSILNPQEYLACSVPITAPLVSCVGQTAYAGYGATADNPGSYYVNTDKNGDPA